ncbi:hypothetical protein M9458_031257, partial [Cirrhinus mrigala]
LCAADQRVYGGADWLHHDFGRVHLDPFLLQSACLLPASKAQFHPFPVCCTHLSALR